LLAALTAAATAATAEASGADGRGSRPTGPAALVSFQALSAGRIRQALPPGAPKLAATASAARAPTWSALSADLTQIELGAARAAMSELSGASYWRWSVAWSPMTLTMGV
jgi:hypothetical protein